MGKQHFSNEFFAATKTSNGLRIKYVRLFFRWLQSLTMEVILSTAFGVKAETQTIENDPITEMAKKAMAPNPLVGIMCEDLVILYVNIDIVITLLQRLYLPPSLCQNFCKIFVFSCPRPSQIHH